jgi:hypothetical protein
MDCSIGDVRCRLLTTSWVMGLMPIRSHRVIGTHRWREELMVRDS